MLVRTGRLSVMMYCACEVPGLKASKQPRQLQMLGCPASEVYLVRRKIKSEVNEVQGPPVVSKISYCLSLIPDFFRHIGFGYFGYPDFGHKPRQQRHSLPWIFISTSVSFPESRQMERPTTRGKGKKLSHRPHLKLIGERTDKEQSVLHNA